MAQNEKIRTEDVIECLDVKILTAEGHPAISVLPNQNYDSVLNQLAFQVLSPAQKEAFDSTLTTPSPTNPVVLKNDLDIYVPQADLGEIRDSVPTYADLPNPFVRTGTITLDSNRITGLSSTTNIIRGFQVDALGLPSGTKVVDIISSTEIQITNDALITSTESITFSPVIGELRCAIQDGIIYRWSETLAWLPFARTGTMQHPDLYNKNNEAAYQHVTLTEKTQLLGEVHTHANKSILDNIRSAGSGYIITSPERLQLPASNQKDALLGTAGVPSDTNRYVTTNDPRIQNRATNPYVTVGPIGSEASYSGHDQVPFDKAMTDMKFSVIQVNAILVIPSTYIFRAPIIWEDSASLLIDNFTPESSILSVQTTFNAGIQASNSGASYGPLIIRGFVIELNGTNTIGISSTRQGTIIEDCVFRQGLVAGTGQKGIILSGQYSIIRRCTFEGDLEKGIEIKAPNCTVENCTFNLTDPTKYGVDIYSNSALIMANQFLSGKVNIQTGISYTNVVNNNFVLTTDLLYRQTNILDNGYSTRFLGNQPEEVNQPYIGKKRTVGSTNSYADFRGNDETPFIHALNDVNVKEIEVLDGTYIFNNPVTLGVGQSIRGASPDAAIIQGTGISLFEMSSYSKLENLNLSSSDASLVASLVSTKIAVENCIFNLTTGSSSDYELELGSIVDATVNYCFFRGTQGVHINGSVRAKILHNNFLNPTLAFKMEGVCQKDQIKDNYFQTMEAPAIVGDYQLVENNHFLGDLPTKLDTLNSVWQGNWPENGNNDSGIDTITVSVDQYLQPISTTVERSVIAGTGSISFPQDITGSAATLPVSLPARLDKGRSYTVNIYWTSDTTGDVYWQMTVVFRDKIGGVIGTYIQDAVLSSKGSADPLYEEMASITFSNYSLLTDPTHVAITIERLGADPSDTMAANAHLLNVEIILPRD
jgi:hypothetical protein